MSKGWKQKLKDWRWWWNLAQSPFGNAVLNKPVLLVLGSAALIAWAYLEQWLDKPFVIHGIEIYLIVLLTFMFGLYAYDRKQPRLTKPVQDLEWGLTFESIVASYNPNNEKAVFNIGVLLANYTYGPIRYEIKKFEVSFGRVIRMPVPEAEDRKPVGFLGKGARKLTNRLPFAREEFDKIALGLTEGSAEIVIEYGHAHKGPERRVVIKAKLILEKHQLDGTPKMLVQTIQTQPSLDHDILSEEDEPIES